jgi:hypothetical protein
MRVEAINLLRSSGTKAISEIIEVHSQGGEDSEHLNLREDPSAMARIAAASQHPTLAAFLVAINGEGSFFSTVGVKVWTSDPLQTGEDTRFHSQVDLIFTHQPFNLVDDHYEDVVRRLMELWMKDSADSLTAQLEILPCRFISPSSEGVGLRIVFTARGSSAEQARTRWGLGLMKVQQALLFVSRAMRQSLGVRE